jgi:hypothetical protein
MAWLQELGLQFRFWGQENSQERDARGAPSRGHLASAVVIRGLAAQEALDVRDQLLARA